MARKTTTVAGIETFAKQHRLKTRIDVDGTPVILGRTGHIYEFSSTHLGVLYSYSKDLTSQRWNTARTACEAAGMSVEQFGDREGTLSFDPGNPKQAKLAIKTARCKTRRVVTEAQLAHLASIRTDGLSALAGRRTSPATS
jgi:hypothetical protein